MFPKTDFTTIEGSTTFIKKLIAVSLSSITYMRGIFPEHAYGERKLGGLKLKLLNENCGVKAVAGFIDLVRGCYDAVEKKYLHQLSVGVCLNPENRNEVIEAYKLEFRYTNDECSITCRNKTSVFSPKQNDPTVKASFLMLKNIYTVSDLLGPLPKCPYITLKLLYYDEVTPPDYEPPGFEPSADVKFNFPEKCLNIDLGKVDTKQHGFKFLLKSAVRKPSLSQPEDPLLAASQSLIGDGKMNSSVNDTHSVHNRSQSVISSSKGSCNTQLRSFKCICESKMGNNTNTIACGSCEARQHKTCYGIIREEDIPEVFYCVDCVILNTDGKESTDMVYKYRGKELKEFCLMRRALMLCAMRESLTQQDLEKCLGCTKSFSKILIDRLELEGYVARTEDRGVYSVDDAHLQATWNFYFPDKENEDLVEANNLPNESPLKEVIEINEDTMHEDDGQNYIDTPENENKENDDWVQKSNHSKSQDYTLNHSPELDSSTMDDITNVDSSIQKVKRLSISSAPTVGSATRKSRKRKVSDKGVVNDSDELFQSQKKPRRKRRT